MKFENTTAAMTTMALLTAALLTAAPIPARAQDELPVPDSGRDGVRDPAAPSRQGAEDATDGRLLFRTAIAGEYVAAPRVGTWVTIDVSGLVARTTVTQRFYNPTDGWLEGIYVFPLPDGSAVDGLRMQVGDRQVEGRIREKVRARREYDRARRQGRVTVLAEQRRSDVFRTSVANVAPGVDVIVEIEYQSLVDYDDGEFSVRFPLVVAPRYGSSPRAALADAGCDGHAPAVGDGIVSAEGPAEYALTPGFEVVVAPRGEGDVDPVDLVVDLDAGVALSAVSSSSHVIDARRVGHGRYQVSLARGAVRANRDFVLSWRPLVTDEPLLGLHEEWSGDHTYQLLMLVPPEPEAVSGPGVPREVIFVIDTSGSMAGTSLREAKAALRTALGRLDARDSFNIIEFDSFMTTVFEQARPATDAAVAAARGWLADLEADGGTEMKPALARALAVGEEVDKLRQIVFITDGQVANEEELLALIRDSLGDSRLFTVGIGSAPNGSFMRRAAAAGRGTFVFIASVEEVGERMSSLLTKLERPTVTDVEVDYGTASGAIVWPERVPDLYAGEPVLAVARIPGVAPPVRISGRVDAEPWQVEAAAEGDGSGHVVEGGRVEGIAKLWAARTIESLTDRLSRRDLGADERTETEQTATELALAFGLVTRFTSLVAVDAEVSRGPGERLASGRVATEPPAGWRHRRALAGRPVHHEHWSADVTAGLHASAPPSAFGDGAEVRLALAALPQTDAGSRVRLLAGIALLLLALLLARGAFISRRIGE
ncbi:MAG: marine proteobacterial sortase target protein [Candidatus Binatia bacterium]